MRWQVNGATCPWYAKVGWWLAEMGRRWSEWWSKYRWHRWFAWYPVTLEDRQTRVWLGFVDRCWYCPDFTVEPPFWRWYYKRPSECKRVRRSDDRRTET